jgi:hypothetical protein
MEISDVHCSCAIENESKPTNQMARNGFSVAYLSPDAYLNCISNFLGELCVVWCAVRRFSLPFPSKCLYIHVIHDVTAERENKGDFECSALVLTGLDDPKAFADFLKTPSTIRKQQ